MRHLMTFAVLSLGSFFLAESSVFAWHDQTHLAISQAAGYQKWYNSASADMAKDIVQKVEMYNHWYNNNNRVEITPLTVMEQIDRYNSEIDTEGHLYGAIIASLREFEVGKSSRKYADYNIAFCAHYIGDLSQPFHNIPYNDFNKARHLVNDGLVEQDVLSKKGIRQIKNHMYKISLGKKAFEEDLAIEIARIGNLTRELGYKLEKENRNMTKEEVYIQLGHSASLLKAILSYLHKAAKP
ncbi:MAG TPA: hypothetical protein PKD55_13250 [Bellilinea sp.]|nr:hypothetical protein [Bellilinea sp.]